MLPGFAQSSQAQVGQVGCCTGQEQTDIQQGPVLCCPREPGHSDHSRLRPGHGRHKVPLHPLSLSLGTGLLHPPGLGGGDQLRPKGRPRETIPACTTLSTDPHTALSTEHKLHCKLSTHCTVYCPHNALFTVHTMHCSLSSVHTIHCPLITHCTVHCPLFTVPPLP